MNKTKYSEEQKQEVLLDMLLHFKNKNDVSNRNLAESGESKYCSPFERVEAQDIKDYALSGSILEGWENI